MRVRLLARILFFGALIAGAAIAVVSAPAGVETGVYELLGDDAGALGVMARRTSSIVRVLCDTPEAEQAAREVAVFLPSVEPMAALELVRTKGRGLLGARHRELLAAGATNKIARSAMRRDFAGIGLFSKRDDPYYFLNDFIMELKAFRPEGRLLTGEAETMGDGIDALIDLARKRTDIHLSGAPFHARLATEASRREINVLTAVSLAAVLAIGWWLFRSWGFVLPVVLALAVGFLAGGEALFVMTPRPHVLTFLFGTTLIGLGVDYCYHSLTGVRLRSLACALATTTLAFSPLFFSGLPVLRQMATFTVTGLVAICLFSVLFLRRAEGAKSASGRRRSVPAVFAVGLVLLAALGLLRLRVDNDPARFYVMDPLLRDGEAKVASASRLDQLRFRPVDLERWQRENAALKAKMGIEPSGDYLTAADLPRWMTFELDGRTQVLLPSVDGIDLRGRLKEIFERYAREAYRLLAMSLVLLFAVLLAVFRRRFLHYLLPMALALVSTAGVIGWVGRPVSFFQVLCVFALMGMGIDYTIFSRDGVGDSRTVKGSFLTSFIGFGLLSFTSFEVTRAMGFTLGTGLFFAYFFSRGGADGRKIANWAERPEQCAGRWRIAFMFWLLRWLGRGPVKAAALVVVVVAYPFVRIGRDGRALRFRKVLNFAWSLVDKSAACAGFGRPPRFVYAGDQGWRDGGGFLLSTHIGCVEVLPAAQAESTMSGRPKIKVHAFQQLTHNAVFTAAFLRHVDPERLRLHAVEEIGVETAVEMQEAIRRGELVLMAADRAPATGGRRGVFRFAKLMESPVYAISCIATGFDSYEVRARKLGPDLEREYEEFRAEILRRHPDQNYEF